VVRKRIESNSNFEYIDGCGDVFVERNAADLMRARPMSRHVLLLEAASSIAVDAAPRRLVV
jgi:hypothetical protein